MTYYLYHKISPKGLNYLGITNRSHPERYKGSGLYWKSHLKKHNFKAIDIATIILFETEDRTELRKMGLYYSDLYNVVESDDWANLMPESAYGGVGRKLSEEHKQKISKFFKGRPGHKHTEEDKLKISLAKRGKKIKGLKVIDTVTGIIYNSVTEAAQQNNLKRTTLTKKMIKGTSNFKYLNDRDGRKEKRPYRQGGKFSEKGRENIRKSCPRKFPVRNKKTGEIFLSIAEAAKSVPCDKSYLAKCLRNNMSQEFEYYKE